MSGLKLYEITNQYQMLIDNSDNIEELESIKDNIKDKAVNVAAYIKNMEAEEMAILNAIKQMKERSECLSKKIESLKDYLLFNLVKCDVKEIRSSQFDIKIKKCPPSLLIHDEINIDDEYKTIKNVISIDKNKVKNDLLNGIIVPGAEVVINNRLEIK